MKKSNYITIRQYLENRGITPVKDRGYYGMYYSPSRKDTNPSFKVDYGKDLWHDFGTNEGGSIVDLLMKLENYSLSEALQKLDDSFSFHRDTPVIPSIPREQESAIKIQNVIPLAHPALLDYLKERGIDKATAKHYCSEIHYSIAGKPYFAIGFRNDAGGWELRNRNFKGSSTPKNITTINNGSDTVMVFEGFIDFLSYLSLKGNPSPAINTAVLNSVTGLQKAIPFLQSHRTVHTFLDNDEAGQRSLASLRELLSSSDVVDQSSFYRNYKDLNDYWRDKSNPKNQVMETKAAVQIKRQIPVKKRSRGL